MPLTGTDREPTVRGGGVSPGPRRWTRRWRWPEESRPGVVEHREPPIVEHAEPRCHSLPAYRTSHPESSVKKTAKRAASKSKSTPSTGGGSSGSTAKRPPARSTAPETTDNDDDDGAEDDDLDQVVSMLGDMDIDGVEDTTAMEEESSDDDSSNGKSTERVWPAARQRPEAAERGPGARSQLGRDVLSATSGRRRRGASGTRLRRRSVARRTRA